MSRARTLAGAIGSDGALNVADVAGLAAVASSGSASDLSTGTLPIARIADGAVTSVKIASGVAVANIGYTPVNKAGDTMTGPLGVGVFTIGSNSGEARLGRANDRSVGVATLQLGGTAAQKFEIVDKGWSSVLFSVTDAGVMTTASNATISGRLTANQGLTSGNGPVFVSSGSISVAAGGSYGFNFESACGLLTSGFLVVRGNENAVNQTVRIYSWNLSYYWGTSTRYVRIREIHANGLNNGYGDVYAYLGNYSGSYATLDQSYSGTPASTSDIFFRNAVGQGCSVAWSIWST